MAVFIDRENERKIITDSLQALSDDKNILLRAPILSFHGIDGIGKTSILHLIEEKCREMQMQCISVKANKNAQEFSRDIIQQVRRYNISTGEDYDQYLLKQSIAMTKDLLNQGVVVMLLDAVETTNQELVERIASTLREVIDGNKLFVVLASRKVLSFETERTVARKLTSVTLKPFDRKSCGEYLDTISITLEPEIRDYIYDWTQGYPLALEVMTNAIVELALDPRIVANQQPLMEHVFQRVIEEKVLARVKPSMREKYQKLLLLLSVPRRFNLLIMQELIDAFEPSFKLESSLAYMNLSKEMIRETGVLSWSMVKGGFSVDTPIRHIYLLKKKIEQGERYLAIHRFLAELNARFVDSTQFTNGVDHVWYIREYLYHSSFTLNLADLTTLLERSVQQIVSGPPVLFEQFDEEFSQDTELQEQLGYELSLFIHILLYRHRAQMNLQLARQASHADRLDYLRLYFYYTLKDQRLSDQRSHLDNLLHDLMAEDPQLFTPQVFAELAQGERFQADLDPHAALFAVLVQELFAEGQ